MDLLIRGGTVVTAGGSRLADVAVDGARISGVLDPAEGATAAEGAGEVVDATGLLVLPGCIDVHTHTRVATDAEPDRFFQDTVAAAFGGTTTVFAFNNAGTGSSAAAQASLRVGLAEWQAATSADAAIDVALSLVVAGTMADPLADLPVVVEAGVPTAKAFMVYDFRLDDVRLFETLGAMARAGGMLEVHCEDPVLIDAAVASALQRGDTLPRYHATTRRPEAEAVATHRAMEFARAADAPVHVVHLSSELALEEVRRAKASGVHASAETCPHYLALTDDLYAGPVDESIRYVISPPLRSAADRDALWAGLADGTLDLVATDHVPDRLAVEKRLPALPFPDISNGAPGVETLLTIVYSEGVARVGSRWSGWSTFSRRRLLAASACRPKVRWRRVSTPTSSSSTLRRNDDSWRPASITRATTRRTRALRCRARSGLSTRAAGWSSRTAPSSVGAAGGGSSSGRSRASIRCCEARRNERRTISR